MDVHYGILHRKIAFAVTTLARLLVVFGMVLAKKPTYLVITTAIFAVVLLQSEIKQFKNQPTHCDAKPAPEGSTENVRVCPPAGNPKRD
jgi:hypothetical protein